MWSVMCTVWVVVLCNVQSVNSDLIDCRNDKMEVVISNFDGHSDQNSNIFFQS